MRLFKNSFFTEHLQWLLQKVSGFQSATLLKNRLRQRCLPVSFAKFLRTYLDRTPPKDCFLCLSMNFERFFRSPFLQRTSGKLLISCIQVAEFQPPDTVKKYFTRAFQAFYTRTRSSYSKAYIYLKCLKICEEVDLQVARCPPAS